MSYLIKSRFFFILYTYLLLVLISLICAIKTNLYKQNNSNHSKQEEFFYSLQ